MAVLWFMSWQLAECCFDSIKTTRVIVMQQAVPTLPQYRLPPNGDSERCTLYQDCREKDCSAPPLPHPLHPPGTVHSQRDCSLFYLTQVYLYEDESAVHAKVKSNGSLRCLGGGIHRGR